MAFEHRHILSMEQFSPQDIAVVLDTAESLKEISTREIKKVPTLRGRTVINVFLEPSTRTRTSFEIAAKRLSADTVSISGSSSSTQKGETLIDTAKNLQAMNPDIVVLRHGHSGSADLIARHIAASVINAGDGTHEHPSQALLDLFTIREKKGRIEGLTVAIAGDILHSRVARSNIIGLTRMGARVRVCGPGTMMPVGIEKMGVEVYFDLVEAVRGVDVVMMLRMQLERHAGRLFPTRREYARRWGLNLDKLRHADRDAVVMHPGPINRGVEIDPEVADGPRAVILDQVAGGVAVRMALLFLLLGGAASR